MQDYENELENLKNQMVSWLLKRIPANNHDKHDRGIRALLLLLFILFLPSIFITDIVSQATLDTQPDTCLHQLCEVWPV